MVGMLVGRRSESVRAPIPEVSGGSDGIDEVSEAEVLAANVRQVEDYRAGKEKAFNSLVGQVMKATKGMANPGQVNEILKKRLSGR